MVTITGADVLLALLILQSAPLFIRGVAIDNGVIGSPNIGCMEDRIQFAFATRKEFNGRVFVKGRSDDPECSSSYTKSLKTSQSVVISLGSCGMQRIRSVDPAGMRMILTVILSFHPIFITKVDRAFTINCFFRPAVAMLTQTIDVSMITTEDLQRDWQMPSCSYDIHKDHDDGPTTEKYVNVGDKLVHVWKCKSKGNMQLRIVNCRASDSGNRQIVDIVDSAGCSVDAILLSDITYDQSNGRAFATSHAYKYADKPTLMFSCTIQLCRKEDCPVIPPGCDGRRKNGTRRSLGQNIVRADDGSIKSALLNDDPFGPHMNVAGGFRFESPFDSGGIMDVESKELTILELGSELTGGQALEPVQLELTTVDISANSSELNDSTESPTDYWNDTTGSVSSTTFAPEVTTMESSRLQHLRDDDHVCISLNGFSALITFTLVSFLIAVIMTSLPAFRLLNRYWHMAKSEYDSIMVVGRGVPSIPYWPPDISHRDSLSSYFTSTYR